VRIGGICTTKNDHFFEKNRKSADRKNRKMLKNVEKCQNLEVKKTEKNQKMSKFGGQKN
jgi:hypothetical protein